MVCLVHFLLVAETKAAFIVKHLPKLVDILQTGHRVFRTGGQTTGVLHG